MLVQEVTRFMTFVIEHQATASHFRQWLQALGEKKCYISGLVQFHITPHQVKIRNYTHDSLYSDFQVCGTFPFFLTGLIPLNGQIQDDGILQPYNL